MDYALLLIVFLAVVCGVWIAVEEYYQQNTLSTPCGLLKLPHRSGIVKFVLGPITLVLVVSLALSIQRPALWHVPAWLDMSLGYWLSGSAALLSGSMMGFGWKGWRQEHLRQARFIGILAALCFVGVVLNATLLQSFVYEQLSDRPCDGKFLLQTSRYSCAAASGANLASLFGIKCSERKMAQYMQTRRTGTVPAAIIAGMRDAGLQGQKFEVPIDLSDIPLPSILIVDHPRSGPETHAILAVKLSADGARLETWDPLVGQRLFSQSELANIWRGHGIRFELAWID